MTDAFAEQGVTDFFSRRGLQPGADHAAADFFQRIGDAGRVARELHGGSIGQVFPLAAHGCFNQIAEESAGIANHHQTDARQYNRQGAIAF